MFKFPFFNKKKFDKLSREEVVDAIVDLEKELNDYEQKILNSKNEINALMDKGAKESDRQVKLFIAKKINMMKADRENAIQKSMYLMYNIQMLNKLKDAIDDNQFFDKNAKLSLGNLLSDQKGLAKFLNKTLKTKVTAENVLTDADETFKNIMDTYEPNSNIYGTSSADDELLAMFEKTETANEEQEFEDVQNEEKSDGDTQL